MPETAQQGHLLIGPPGSGKSCLAATLAPLLRARIVSSDDLRQQLWGHASVQGPWTELEPLLHGAIDSALAAGMNVVVDATNGQRDWRQKLMHRTRDASTAMDRLVAAVPLDQCLAWNQCRQRRVPDTVIRAMHQRLTTPPDRPDLSEGFKDLIRLNPAASSLSDQVNRGLQGILRREER